MLQGDLRIPGILAYIEKSTAFDRGKGKKILPVLDICYDVAEEDFVSTTLSHLQESPKLLILMNNNMFEMAVIKCDERVIFIQAADAAQALIVLLATYYCFQLTYPRCYSQCMGFMQQCIVGEPFVGDKSTNFKHFISLM